VKKLLSIIIPVLNEEKNIPLVYKGIRKAIVGLKKYKYEIIFVDDGSTDGTWNEIKRIRDLSVKGISLSKNFGHATALQAGLESASGHAAVMMDGDLQHPPSLIPVLIREWENGNKIVNTLRIDTKDIGFFKKFTSSVFYKLFNYFSVVKINAGEADFRLVDKGVLNKINVLPHNPKFYRGIVHWLGDGIAYVPYTAEKRKYGKSSYSFKKMINLARAGIMTFGTKSFKTTVISLLSFSTLLIVVLHFLFYKFFLNEFYNNLSLIISAIVILESITCLQAVIVIYFIYIFKMSISNNPAYSIRLSSRIGK
jgi:polyisoprenyl-phosphate glycosyltransferase